MDTGYGISGLTDNLSTQNAHTQFPVPHIRCPPSSRNPGPRFLVPLPSSDPIGRPDSSSPAPDSQDDKENAGPPSSIGVTSNPSSLPVSTPAATVATVTGITQPPVVPGSLPGPIAALLDEITSAIIDNFSDYPPHTIQRLAELVLKPKQHYRTLTAYLHALDRVVHVTSGNNIYPLPPAVMDMSENPPLSNGVRGSNGSASNIAADTSLRSEEALDNDDALGSDEALGGALLTPIPWLSSRVNGTGSSEDGLGSEDGSLDSPVSSRSDSAMSQASPPRQQQQATQQSQAQRSPSQNVNASANPRPQIRTDNTETIDGPNGMGTIETVSVSVVNGVPSMTTSNNTVLASRGVTQGELLRQEQRAGVVPLSQLVRQQQQQAQAQAQSSSNNNNNTADRDEGDVDTDSPMGEQEPEAPHARGPETIDDADIGPQRATTSHSAAYTIGTTADGASIQMQGIDIEAAVGRHTDGTPLEEPRKTSPDHEVETSVPQSPKREAQEDIVEIASKKQKTEGEEEVEKEGEDIVMVPADVPASPNGEADKGKEVERDAEGDVVIRDPDPTEAEAASEEKKDGSN